MKPEDGRVRRLTALSVAVLLGLALGLPLLAQAATPAPALAGTEAPAQPLSGDPPWWQTTTRDLNRNGIEDALEAHPGPYRGLFVVYDGYPGPARQQALEELGLEVRFVDGGINTVVVGQAGLAQAEAAAAQDHVVFVEEEPLFYPSLETSVSAMKVRQSELYSPVAWDDGLDGSGINIAILDTGVDDQHDFLKGSYIAGRDFYNLFDPGDGSANPDDNNGHGTHVASTALGHDPDKTYLGVAPAARLVDVKMMTDVGAGGYIIQAMNWTLEHKDDDWEADGPANNGIQVVSLSISNGGNSDGTDAVSQKGNELVVNGLVVVAAMGNDGNQQVPAPAAGDLVISVANIDDTDTVSRDDDDINQAASNRGPRTDDGDSDTWDELKPDVSAPGTDITAAQAVIGSQGDGSSGTATMTGTSMATPHVSGLVALLLQAEPDLKPESGTNPVLWRLRNLSEPWGVPSFPELSDRYNNWTGHGYVDGYNIVHSEAPDGVIEAAWASPAQPIEGDTVTLYARLYNQGNVDLQSASLRFYDGGAEGELLGTAYLGSYLPPDARTTLSLTWEDPPVGNHSLEALLEEGYPTERSVRNNNYTFNLEVKEQPQGPDLRVDRLELSDDSPTEGQPLTLTGYFSNVGQQRVDSAVLQLYEGDPDDGGTKLDEKPLLKGLDPGDSTTLTGQWEAPAEGNYRLYGQVSEVEPSDANSNNNRLFTSVDVAAKPQDPDFTLSPADLSWDPANPQSDQEVTLSVMVHNIGQKAGQGRLTLNLDGSQLDQWSQVDIEGEASTTLSTTWTATAGSHELEARLDNIDDEADTQNNRAVTLLLVASGGPDYRLVRLDVPALLVAGDQARLQALVRNDGESEGESVTATFYLDGQPLGSDEYSGLRAGLSAVLELDWTPLAGSHALEVVLSSDEDTNPANDRASLDLLVVPPLLLSLSEPYQAGQAGQPLTFELELENLRSTTASGTLTATSAGLVGLTFTSSLAAFATYQIPAYSSRQFQLQADLDPALPAGNYSFQVEASGAGLTEPVVVEGAALLPLVLDPARLELRPGQEGQLTASLYNPLPSDLTFVLAGRGTPQGVTLIINGFEDTDLRPLSAKGYGQSVVEVVVGSGVSADSYQIQLTLSPVAGPEVYQATLTLVVLEGNNDDSDGLLSALSLTGSLVTVVLVAVTLARRKTQA